MKSKLIGYLYIAIGGFFWATLGIFTNALYEAGLSSPQISLLRLTLGAIFLFIYCLITDRSMLRITKKGLIVCILLGLFCQALFNLSYVNAINRMGVSISAVFLYTSPLFMAILSKIVYKEKINAFKIFSLILTILGAFFAATGGNLDPTILASIGTLFGFMAAFFYSIMPFISNSALKENKNVTIVLYSFIFGALFLLPFAHPTQIVQSLNSFSILLNVIGLGLFPACLAFLFFYSGISKDVQFSIVGIFSSTELIFSQIFGWTLFHEEFSVLRLIGILLMVASACVVLYEIKFKRNHK